MCFYHIRFQNWWPNASLDYGGADKSGEADIMMWITFPFLKTSRCDERRIKCVYVVC